MRFKQKQKPNHGDIRTRTKFLLFPKKINGETRWLEKSSWDEICEKYWSRIFEEHIVEWHETNWID